MLITHELNLRPYSSPLLNCHLIIYFDSCQVDEEFNIEGEEALSMINPKLTCITQLNPLM